MPRRSSGSIRSGVTLMELVVTVAVIGLLLALLVPAVRSAMDAARRVICASQLKQIGVALRGYETAKGSFPAGSDGVLGTQIAWSARILPFLDHGPLFAQIDFKKAWDAPGQNLNASRQCVAEYICPSGDINSPGFQDYAGVRGTALLNLNAGNRAQDAFGCGVLIVTGPAQGQPVRAASITDGLTYTLCVGESVDRVETGANSWACGRNCMSQNLPAINVPDIGSLHSRHLSGANGLFADGHVVLLNDDIGGNVLGALCTRNGGESIADTERLQ